MKDSRWSDIFYSFYIGGVQYLTPIPDTEEKISTLVQFDGDVINTITSEEVFNYPDVVEEHYDLINSKLGKLKNLGVLIRSVQFSAPFISSAFLLPIKEWVNEGKAILDLIADHWHNIVWIAFVSLLSYFLRPMLRWLIQKLFAKKIQDFRAGGEWLS